MNTGKTPMTRLHEWDKGRKKENVQSPGRGSFWADKSVDEVRPSKTRNLNPMKTSHRTPALADNKIVK